MPSNDRLRPTVGNMRALQEELARLKNQNGSAQGMPIDVSSVPVVSSAAYVDMDYAQGTSNGEFEPLESARMYNIGSELVIVLDCGDMYAFDGAKLGEVVLAANLLPACKVQDITAHN